MGRKIKRDEVVGGEGVQILFTWMILNNNTKYKNHDDMECLGYNWQSYFEHGLFSRIIADTIYLSPDCGCHALVWNCSKYNNTDAPEKATIKLLISLGMFLRVEPLRSEPCLDLFHLRFTSLIELLAKDL